MTARLTTKQRNVLTLIEGASPSAISNQELAQRLDLPREGTAQTAASLVRRGLIERCTLLTSRGLIVGYVLTNPGA